MNDGIIVDCSVRYITIDDIANRIKSYNKIGVLMAQLDLQDAYKHIFVRPEDIYLLGCVWDRKHPTGDIQREYYMDLTLPFGLKSSAKYFNKYADGLQYAMIGNCVSVVEHYLDDYFTCGAPSTMECAANQAIMCYTCKQLGFSVQPTKLVYPTTTLEYIGITIDSVAMQLRISDERLHDVLDELIEWTGRTSCTKRQLLSLIGKLSFVARVVKCGRTFLRRMIDQTKKARYLHHRITLDVTTFTDISWWISYLPTRNGISMFCDNTWSTNADLELWTDASDTGVGGYLGNEWFMELFEGESTYMKHMTITWRELYAIVKAAYTWYHKLAGKMVLFHCDNEAVCHIIQSGTSRDPDIMSLVRTLFFISAHNDFVCSAVHVRGINNEAADSLSRGITQTFKSLNPDEDRYPVFNKQLPWKDN